MINPHPASLSDVACCIDNSSYECCRIQFSCLSQHFITPRHFPARISNGQILPSSPKTNYVRYFFNREFCIWRLPFLLMETPYLTMTRNEFLKANNSQEEMSLNRVSLSKKFTLSTAILYTA